MDDARIRNPDAEIAELKRRLHQQEAMWQPEHQAAAQIHGLSGTMRFRRWQAELQMAARIHESLLPRPVRHRRIDVDTRYVAVDGIGGDYCQVSFPDDSDCYITLCDVTGHGIGPALLAARVSSEVRRLTFERSSPAEMVDQINRFVLEYFSEAELQLSFFVARLNLKRRTMVYSGAGHPSQVLIRRGTSQVELLESRNVLLGVVEDCLRSEPQASVALARGDRLLFFTDGMTETRNAQGRMLGDAGLTDIARNLCGGSVFEVGDCVLRRIAQYRQGPPHDDMTLMVAELK